VNELALFAGAGGGILGGKLLGWRTVCAVEWEAYPASVLCARQNDKILPTFPIWDDVQTFDGKPWQGIVDVVSGGFPCQDISAAGTGGGIAGSRSSMWKHMARIIGEVQPRYCFVENSPMLTSRGLGTVLGDLAELGFNAEWGVLSAADVGANHLRERIWIVGKNMAYSQSKNVGFSSKRTSGQKKYKSRRGSSRKDEMANAISKGLQRGLHRWQDSQWESKLGHSGCSSSTHGQSKQGWWSSEPNVGRVANGVANRVDRLKAIGNGQVPLCAATAWRLLKERLDGYEQRGMA
jgi:DNA (cytosine-5)-methyltransferase 1